MATNTENHVDPEDELTPIMSENSSSEPDQPGNQEEVQDKGNNLEENVNDAVENGIDAKRKVRKTLKSKKKRVSKRKDSVEVSDVNDNSIQTVSERSSVISTESKRLRRRQKAPRRYINTDDVMERKIEQKYMELESLLQRQFIEKKTNLTYQHIGQMEILRQQYNLSCHGLPPAGPYATRNRQRPHSAHVMRDISDSDEAYSTIRTLQQLTKHQPRTPIRSKSAKSRREACSDSENCRTKRIDINLDTSSMNSARSTPRPSRRKSPENKGSERSRSQSPSSPRTSPSRLFVPTDHHLKETHNPKLKKWLHQKNIQLRKQKIKERAEKREKRQESIMRESARQVAHEVGKSKVQEWMRRKRREAIEQAKIERELKKREEQKKKEEAEKRKMELVEGKGWMRPVSGTKKKNRGDVISSEPSSSTETEHRSSGPIPHPPNSKMMYKRSPAGRIRLKVKPKEEAESVERTDKSTDNSQMSYTEWLKKKREEDEAKKKAEAEAKAKAVADPDLELVLPEMSKKRIKRVTNSRKSTDSGLRSEDAGVSDSQTSQDLDKSTGAFLKVNGAKAAISSRPQSALAAPPAPLPCKSPKRPRSAHPRVEAIMKEDTEDEPENPFRLPFPASLGLPKEVAKAQSKLFPDRVAEERKSLEASRLEPQGCDSPVVEGKPVSAADDAENNQKSGINAVDNVQMEGKSEIQKPEEQEVGAAFFRESIEDDPPWETKDKEDANKEQGDAKFEESNQYFLEKGLEKLEPDKTAAPEKESQTSSLDATVEVEQVNVTELPSEQIPLIGEQTEDVEASGQTPNSEVPEKLAEDDSESKQSFLEEGHVKREPDKEEEHEKSLLEQVVDWLPELDDERKYDALPEESTEGSSVDEQVEQENFTADTQMPQQSMEAKEPETYNLEQNPETADDDHPETPDELTEGIPQSAGAEQDFGVQISEKIETILGDSFHPRDEQAEDATDEIPEEIPEKITEVHDQKDDEDKGVEDDSNPLAEPETTVETTLEQTNTPKAHSVHETEEPASDKGRVLEQAPVEDSTLKSLAKRKVGTTHNHLNEELPQQIENQDQMKEVPDEDIPQHTEDIQTEEAPTSLDAEADQSEGRPTQQDNKTPELVITETEPRQTEEQMTNGVQDHSGDDELTVSGAAIAEEPDSSAANSLASLDMDETSATQKLQDATVENLTDIQENPDIKEKINVPHIQQVHEERSCPPEDSLQLINNIDVEATKDNEATDTLPKTPDIIQSREITLEAESSEQDSNQTGSSSSAANHSQLKESQEAEQSKDLSSTEQEDFSNIPDNEVPSGFQVEEESQIITDASTLDATNREIVGTVSMEQNAEEDTEQEDTTRGALEEDVVGSEQTKSRTLGTLQEIGVQEEHTIGDNFLETDPEEQHALGNQETPVQAEHIDTCESSKQKSLETSVRTTPGITDGASGTSSSQNLETDLNQELVSPKDISEEGGPGVAIDSNGGMFATQTEVDVRGKANADPGIPKSGMAGEFAGYEDMTATQTIIEELNISTEQHEDSESEEDATNVYASTESIGVTHSIFMPERKISEQSQCTEKPSEEVLLPQSVLDDNQLVVGSSDGSWNTVVEVSGKDAENTQEKLWNTEDSETSSGDRRAESLPTEPSQEMNQDTPEDDDGVGLSDDDDTDDELKRRLQRLRSNDDFALELTEMNRNLNELDTSFEVARTVGAEESPAADLQVMNGIMESEEDAVDEGAHAEAQADHSGHTTQSDDLNNNKNSDKLIENLEQLHSTQDELDLSPLKKPQLVQSLQNGDLSDTQEDDSHKLKSILTDPDVQQREENGNANDSETPRKKVSFSDRPIIITEDMVQQAQASSNHVNQEYTDSSDDASSAEGDAVAMMS